MKKISVRKTAEYSPAIEGKSRYESFDLIARQIYSPGILRGIQGKSIYDVILASSLRRGRETASLYIGMAPTELLDDLREINFSLKSLLSESEYDKHGSDMVRERFVSAFVNDELIEKRSAIKRRLLRILGKLGAMKSGNYLVISHSFFMKLIDIYIYRGDVFREPGLLERYFNTHEKTYNFQEGFEFVL